MKKTEDTPTEVNITTQEIELIIETLDYRYEKMQNSPFSKFLHKEMERMSELVSKLIKAQMQEPVRVPGIVTGYGDSPAVINNEH